MRGCAHVFGRLKFSLHDRYIQGRVAAQPANSVVLQVFRRDGCDDKIRSVAIATGPLVVIAVVMDDMKNGHLCGSSCVVADCQISDGHLGYPKDRAAG